MSIPTSLNTPLDNLLWLAHQIGRDPHGLVVLSEGNVSARIDEGRFLVKSTGACLGELTPSDVTECHTEAMLRIMETPLLDAVSLQQAISAAQTNPNGRRASFESTFHAFLLTLPGVQFVAHCHPDALLQILCSPAAERFAEHRMFPEEVEYVGAQSVYVPYTDPGVPLAREVRSKMQLAQRRTQNRPARLILLQNHGVIAIGSTARAVLGTLLMAEKAARVFVGAARLGGPLFLPPQHIARLEGRGEETQRTSTIRL